MIEKFDLSLKDELESRVRELNYKDYNLSFTNMYMWRDMYKLGVHIEKDFVIVFSQVKHEEIFSLNPICAIDQVEEAMQYLLAFFEKYELDFTIHNCVTQVKNKIEEIYGDFFIYEATRDSFDYLYTVEKILSYSGKKLQKKRNHVNNFIKTYEGRYETKIIAESQAVIDDCIGLVQEWDKNKEERDEYIDQEVKGTIDVLNNFNKLSCEGLAVYIDGKIEAFGVGTRLNDTTAVLNIEKANSEIRGLYPFVRQQVVKTFFSDLKYINTEDDIGDENLRKSKLSYQPEYLVEKFTITRKDEQKDEV